MFKFDPSKVDFTQPLGEGTFGDVFAFAKDPTDKRWVIKRIVATSVKKLVENIQETLFSFRCDHPNIVSARGYHIDHNIQNNIWTIYIKFPRMEKNLTARFREYFDKNESISNQEIVRYFHSLVCGLEHIHQKGIAHRDLKPDNILIGYDGKIGIADIGAGKLVLGEDSYLLTEMAGNKAYAAPEILDPDCNIRKKELFKADIWSLGLVMTELCALKTRLVNSKVSGPIKEEKLSEILAGLEGKYDKVILDLILNLVRSDPSKRISLADAKRILEENYAEILGSVQKTQTVQEKWGDFFTFGPNTENGFEVKAKAVDWGDVIVKGLINDLVKSKAENNYKSFEKLSLNLENCTWITNKTLQDITFQLRNLKNLLNLDLNFKGCNQIKDDTVINHANDIGSHLRSLKSLNLSYSECSKISDQAFKQLFVQIGSGLRKLQNLELNLKNCYKITDQNLQDLSAQFVNLEQLQSLSLNFSECVNLQDDSIIHFSKLIKSNLCRLECLSLSFANCNQISDSAFKELCDQIGTTLKDLRRLSLNFSTCCKLDKTIQNLAIAENLKGLTHLAFDLSGCKKLRSEGVQSLATQIGKFKNLEQLELYLAYNWKEQSPLTDASSIELFRQIGSLKNLRSLVLKMPYSLSITDQIINELANQIQFQLTNLQTLHLDFSNCWNISDQAVKALSSKIGSKLTSLRDFYINLKGLRLLSNEAANELFSVISLQLNNLQVLNLDLRLCKNVNDNSLLQLADSIKINNRVLKSLTLYISGCPQVTDHARAALKNAVNKNCHLEIW